MTQHLELQKLREEGRYARFLKVDLHVHTPATPWCWNATRVEGELAASRMKPRDVATAILKSGIDLAVITDHDCVSWLADIIRETREMAKKQRRSVTVLPGVEVTTYDGVHLLAIFPVNKAADAIRDMLIRFGLKADGTVSERADEKWPVARVAAEIRNEGGLVVAPHVTDSQMGLWGGSKTHHAGKRVAWMREGVARILACAPSQRSSLEAAIRNAGVNTRFAFVRHSDAHRFEDIGKDATFIKLSERTVEGLRQVIHEPELRVALDPPPEATHPFIVGVEIDGGYFDLERVAFSEHLNVLVGPNYSGKSSIVDALRFVFDDPCFGDEEERQLLLARVRGIIRSGQIRVWFRDREGTYYRAERSTAIEEVRGGVQPILQASVLASVSRFDGDVEVPIDKSPQEIQRIDFYGQGCVGRVSQFEERHRDLIDALGGTSQYAAALDPTRSQPAGTLAKLFRNATQLQSTAVERADLEKELAQTTELSEQRKKLEAQAKSELLSGWAGWQEFDRAVEGLEEAIETVSSDCRYDELYVALFGDVPALPNPRPELKAATAPIRDAIERFTAQLQSATKELSKRVALELKTLRAVLAKWDAAYDQQEKRVKEKLRELNLATDAALAKRVNELSKRIEALEKKRPQLDRLEKQWNQLTRERQRLLLDLKSEWGELRSRRAAFATELNAATGDEIHISFESASDKSRLWQKTESLITGHSSKATLVQRRDSQIDLLVNAYDAEDLSAALARSDVAELMARSGVTLNTAQFLVELPLEARLALAGYVTDDAVTITYRRQGDSEHTSLTSVSPGERALALLTVAFANRLSPIVIDQPEDELGQALVTADLVGTIRRKKLERQFVIVTHNANVPVLGDAEGIFCLVNEIAETGERRCAVRYAGAIECEPIKAALLGLEGGRESFEKRQEKYNINSLSG